MKAKRNTSGLKTNAQAKRQEAFDKVEKGIQKLLKEKRPINFNQVAEASGVSKAWLYKESDVKKRIEHLRAQSKQGKKLPRKISATEASTKALNITLQSRIKKVEAENRELRRQNETVYGQLLRLRELERQVERLKAENQRLKNQSAMSPTERTDFAFELEGMGVKMNSTLEKLISETPESIVRTAIKALKEAQTEGQVKNPGGFLNKAVRDAWEPNGQLQQNDELSLFNEWWPKARQQGLVVGSEQQGSSILIHTAQGEALPFADFYQTHPIA